MLVVILGLVGYGEGLGGGEGIHGIVVTRAGEGGGKQRGSEEERCN